MLQDPVRTLNIILVQKYREHVPERKLWGSRLRNFASPQAW